MKVLILTGKFGMGHYSAANTLAADIRQSALDADVVVADIYETAFPECYDMVYMVYSSLVGKGGMIYNWAYNKTVSSKKEGVPSKNPVTNHMLKRLETLVQQQRPDVVIATYSLCAHLMSLLKLKTGWQIPLVTCITDVTTHTVWINRQTDLYLVAAPCTKESLLELGVPEQRILISGIPVRSSFQQPVLRQETVDKPKELLLMGGGLGLLPADKEFYVQLDKTPNVHTTVITGKNEKLYRKLAGKFERIQVLGFTNQVAHYMRQADLIITKPGGITMFEAIHSELPMLVFQPFLEQEVKNGEYLQANGLGIVLDKKPEEAISEIRGILRDTGRLEMMKANMRQVKESLQPQGLIQFLTACQAEIAQRKQVA